MRALIMAAAAVFISHAAMAQNDSSPVGGVGSSTAVVVVPAVPALPAGTPPGFSNARVWQRIMNVGTSPTGPVAWCTRYGTPAVGAPKSWPLAPAGNANGWPWKEEFKASEGIVPQGQTSCIAASGTVPITAEEQ